MARSCVLCGKGPTTGNSLSHSHIRTRRRWLPNLQKAKLLIGGVLKQLLVCTRCLRSHKTKATATAKAKA